MKGNMHDLFRDTLFTICRELTPLAGITSSKSQVGLEPRDLIPEAPTIRPADICFPIPNLNGDDTKAIAVDISLHHH